MKDTKILIVEDEPFIAMGIEQTLRKFEYSVTDIACSGEECLNSVLVNRPDLILMDIKLSGEIDGIEAAAAIRENYDIPVIFLTALSDELSLQRAKITEPYGYIVKPINERELYFTIEISKYRHEIENNLRESEKKYHALFEQSRDPIFLFNEYGNITDINRSMIDLFGYNRDEMIGMNMRDLFILFEKGDEFLSSIREASFVENYEIELKKKDCSQINCLITCVIIFDDHKDDPVWHSIIRDITEKKRLAEEKEILLHNISKRVKELNCLYTLSEIVERPGITLDEIIEEMIDIIPLSWQYPDITCVRAVLYDKEFKSDNFQLTEWRQASDIFIDGKKRGIIEVCYLKEMPLLYEGPFLNEERSLIDSIAERLGRIAEYKDAVEELIKSRDQLRSLSSHLQSVREEERTMIAREIHDELGQSLTAFRMDLSWIKNRLNTGQNELMDKIESMINHVDATVESVRKISSKLRPGLLDDLGLSAAIEWHTGKYGNSETMKCEVVCDPEDIIVNSEQAISIFRIFQEALTNVVRHSGATLAEVLLTEKDEAVELTIRDNGKGITDEQANAPGSFGIIGMRERVNSCSGKISIKGAQNKGTIVKVIIPLNK
ncbi:MAG: PAS domain S-box protein [Spirochaetota bacterium]|nr:PAS domain S-box protein [Spirochaetota bacterium]